ncbi:TPA: phage tail protein [Citrobacter freundii]|uniref:phage tail protein n=2 Tax=Citrobacter freundii TaxID=546 RepID=UPI00292AB6A0|nr:phage tail protein [Citrobacter freundii]MDV2014624.1 phage tail protein [Citrobacter freundii]MEB0382459.1 phage tail protein [Citrobacter freundii]MEB1036381.1 phage tail protein [Citrobacter freundii]HCJ7437564.1 phage tail protein [Citrobacter freundii]
MAINNFKPFATAANANVTNQTDWETLPALLSGFTAGKASSAQVNKAIRQASFIAAALAQYTANKSGLDILDDGDLNGFITKMSSAFGKDYQALDATLTALAGLATGANKLPYFTDTDKAAQTDLTQVGRDIIGKNTIADILTYLHLEELPNFAKYGAPMIGELIEWPSDKMPNEIYPDMKMEFIPYIGQSFDPVKYPLLATLHPNLRLPADMRANVARGWDWGRGIDAGRALMSAQDDAMQRITGELTDMCSGDSLQATGALTITAKPAQHWYAAATVSSAYLYYRAIGFDNASVARTANENRMKNVAWNMIVRAK